MYSVAYCLSRSGPRFLEPCARRQGSHAHMRRRRACYFRSSTHRAQQERLDAASSASAKRSSRQTNTLVVLTLTGSSAMRCNLCWKDLRGQAFLTRCRHLFCKFWRVAGLFSTGVRLIPSEHAVELVWDRRMHFFPFGYLILTLSLSQVRCVSISCLTNYFMWSANAFSWPSSPHCVDRLGLWA